VEVKKNSSNGGRYTAEKVHGSSSKVLSFIDLSQPELFPLYGLPFERHVSCFRKKRNRNGRRDTAGKVHCSPCKIPFNINRSNLKRMPFVGHAPWVIGVEFQKIPWNGRRDTAEKVQCWPSKKAFVFGRS